jgi:hypothetical protein
MLENIISYNELTYRVVSDRLFAKFEGNGPLKLLYPKSNASSSFNSAISLGMFP